MSDITAGFLCDSLLSSIYQEIVHCLPSILLFATNLSYGFISKPTSLSVVDNRFYHNNADSMQPYITLITDGIQTNTSPFYTHHLIRVNYKVVSKLFQLIYLEFSYLNSVRHFSCIELCREKLLLFFYVSR